MSFEIQTLVMQYLFGGLLSLIPVLAWGYIFWKKDPEGRKVTFISFLAGIFSTFPILFYNDFFGGQKQFLGIDFPNYNLFSSINNLANEPTLIGVGIFLISSVVTALFLFAVVLVMAFLLDIIDGEDSILSFRKKAVKILSETYTFAFIGLCIGLLAYLFGLSVEEAFFTYLLVGALEEFVKHLWVRFVDDDKFHSINDVILLSIVVGLGFAFFENILYFVNKIWLSPCSKLEIENGVCLLNQSTGEYVHNIGVLFFPFIGRALLSVLAHACFSGIFGLFYGYAVFGNQELQKMQYENRHPFVLSALQWFHRIFRFRMTTLYHEEKVLEGLFLAMFLHMVFNFLLEKGFVLQAGILIFGCFFYVSYLFSEKENHEEQGLFLDKSASPSDKTSL
jgi:RsiW-degrading membrane proteinase PrsW (M82 family)